MKMAASLVKQGPSTQFNENAVYYAKTKRACLFFFLF